MSKGKHKRVVNPFEHRSDGTTVLLLRYKNETKECVVWTVDYAKVKGHRWRAQWSGKQRTFYALTGKKTRMHRLLVPDCEQVDHRNHNTLDNRVYDPQTDTGNIRPATAPENGCNKHVRKHSSVFKGVSWDKKAQEWRAKIKVKYKQIHLGYFESELEASFAYQEAAKKYQGDFACEK